MSETRAEFWREKLAKYGGELSVERRGICDTCGQRSSGPKCFTMTLGDNSFCQGNVTRGWRYEKNVMTCGSIWPGKWFPEHAEALDELLVLARETKERQVQEVEGWWTKRREERRKERGANK